MAPSDQDLSLTPLQVKGLLDSVGIHLARLPRARFHALKHRLEEATSPEAFAADLHDAELGIAAPAREALIREACLGDDWEAMKMRLLKAMELTRANERWSGN